MKVCPSCRQNYDDDVEVCPDDGTELIPAPEDLPENPELREVQQVSPDEHTAMIDVDAIEAERARRGIEKPAPAEPEPEPEPDDPDATGTVNIDALRKARSEPGADTSDATAEGSALDEAPEMTQEVPAPTFDKAEATQITRQRPRSGGKKPSKKSGSKDGGKRALVLAAILGGSLLIAAGLVGGAFYFFGAGKRAVLTVTSVPPGATVLLDGDKIGEAPLQEKVKVGNHVLELKLAGFLDFKEVVDVPVEGLPFLQPLEADPRYVAPTDAGPAQEDAGAPAGKADAGAAKAPVAAGGADAGAKAAPRESADELIARFERLLSEKDFDAAFDALKDFVRAWPDDKRGDGLFDKLAEARMKGASRPSTGRRGVSSKSKTQRAREAYTEGELAYRDRNLKEAKAKFQNAIQLDPRFARPHRAIARIYQKDDNVARARYHLERYLGLGGKDPDYRVRRWLEEHPRK